MKLCSKCKTEKPVTEFGRDKTTTDGLNRQCKACIYARHRAWRLENGEKVAQWDRDYRKRSRGKINETRRKWREGNRDRNAEIQEKWIRENPEKASAHKAVARAIKRGGMIRPDVCGRCHGAPSRIEAHHRDYSKPLEVEWLCVTCHREADKERQSWGR